MSSSAQPPSVPVLRLDKWLWFARVVRTRSLATKLCAAGCVVLSGHPSVKAHQLVRIGDVVTIELSHQRRRLIVRALGTRRGPPAEARALYDEPAPPLSLRDTEPAWISLFADEDERSEVNA